MSWWHNLPAENKQLTAEDGSDSKATLVADRFVNRLCGRSCGPLGGFFANAAAASAGGKSSGTAPVDLDRWNADVPPSWLAKLRPPPRPPAVADEDDGDADEVESDGEKDIDCPRPPHTAAAPDAPAASTAATVVEQPPPRAAEHVISRRPPASRAAVVAKSVPPGPVNATNLAWALTERERNNTFFLEWRITDTGVCDALAKAQNELAAASAGQLEVLQSCAVDNLHITLNELTINTQADLERCLGVLRDCNERLKGWMQRRPPAELKGVHNFGQRVFFVPVVGPGHDALQEIFQFVQKALSDAGLRPKPPKGGGLTAHITLGKLKPGGDSGPITNAVQSLGLASRSFGSVPVRDVVFCVKRKKSEATPPVLQTYPLP